MGVLPLSFAEERADRVRPADRGQLPVPDDDPLDNDPAEFLPALGRRRLDRIWQSQDPRTETTGDTSEPGCRVLRDPEGRATD